MNKKIVVSIIFCCLSFAFFDTYNGFSYAAILFLFSTIMFFEYSKALKPRKFFELNINTLKGIFQFFDALEKYSKITNICGVVFFILGLFFFITSIGYFIIY